jgi:hypothetical protein
LENTMTFKALLVTKTDKTISTGVVDVNEHDLMPGGRARSGARRREPREKSRDASSSTSMHSRAGHRPA